MQPNKTKKMHKRCKQTHTKGRINMWSMVRMQEARSRHASMDLKMNMDISMEHPNMTSQKDWSRNKSK